MSDALRKTQAAAQAEAEAAMSHKAAKRLRRQARELCAGRQLDAYQTNEVHWKQVDRKTYKTERPIIKVNPNTFRGIVRGLKKAARTMKLA